jgi:hypothetical protein
MQTGLARALLMTLGAGCFAFAGCSPPETAAVAPHQVDAQQNRQSERDQRELARRRLQLENQVLAELRTLRQSRQASTGAAEPAREDEPVSAPDYELQVFGGASHEVFLGCLCDEQRPDSVFNLAGEHGSDMSADSIRNKFAPYGSDSDDTSACNPAATHPPVVVASDGKSLGLLTINPSLKRRITAPSVADWLARVCAG